MSRRAEAILLPIGAAALVLALWWAAVRASGTRVFPSPVEVARGVVELARRRLLFAYACDSLVRVFAGYAAAAALGLPLGLALGRWRAAAATASPILQILRPISPIAWTPVAIVLFGVGNGAPIFLVFLGAFFPIVVSTLAAVEAVPPVYLRAGANFGLSPAALVTRVVLPAALPRIVGGLRIAFGVAWSVIVAAEMIAIDSGLGYLIVDARNAGKRYDLVVAGMLLIGGLGLLLDALLWRVTRLPRLRWGFRKE